MIKAKRPSARCDLSNKLFIQADDPETDGCRILQHGQRPVEAAPAMYVSVRTA